MPERRIVPDDHAATIAAVLAVLAEDRPPRRVVHVGAHHGQEVPAYLAAGCERVVLVEANPEHCAVLRETAGALPGVSVVHAAVTDREGTATLRVHASRSGDTQAASLLDLEAFRDVGTLRTTGTVTVPALTLDALYARAGIEPGADDLLVLDVQGAELLALRGGGAVLGRIGAVLCEVALVELYAGSPLEGDIDAELERHGLRRRDARYYELEDAGGRRTVAWGDVVYTR